MLGEQLATRHSNCFVFNLIREPTQDSLIHSILLYNVIFEYSMLYGALVVTMDMLRRLTNCRIIIIIIFFFNFLKYSYFYPR